MQTIHLEPAQVPEALRLDYTGRKFKVVVCEAVAIGSQQWDSGSRDTYTLVELATGRSHPFNDPRAWPLSMAELGSFAIPDGYVVRRHTIFQGQDMGLTFYCRPGAVQSWLPAENSFTLAQECVLFSCRSYKSSYGGRDRYQMATDNSSRFGDGKVTRNDYAAAKESLQAAGYLDARGALTVKGRNAAQGIKDHG